MIIKIRSVTQNYIYAKYSGTRTLVSTVVGGKADGGPFLAHFSQQIVFSSPRLQASERLWSFKAQWDSCQKIGLAMQIPSILAECLELLSFENLRLPPRSKVTHKNTFFSSVLHPCFLQWCVTPKYHLQTISLHIVIFPAHSEYQFLPWWRYSFELWAWRTYILQGLWQTQSFIVML